MKPQPLWLPSSNVSKKKKLLIVDFTKRNIQMYKYFLYESKKIKQMS